MAQRRIVKQVRPRRRELEEPRPLPARVRRDTADSSDLLGRINRLLGERRR